MTINVIIYSQIDQIVLTVLCSPASIYLLDGVWTGVTHGSYTLLPLHNVVQCWCPYPLAVGTTLFVQYGTAHDRC